MKGHYFIITAFMLFVANIVAAQTNIDTAYFAKDTLIFNNGKVFYGNVLDQNNDFLQCEIWKSRKIKFKLIEKDDIFCIHYGKDSTVYYYGRDSIVETFYKLDDMKIYIIGAQDAYNNYKAPLATAGGVLFGAGGALFIGFYGLGIVSPALYTAILSTQPPAPKINQVRDKTYLNNPVYKDGFSTTANKKKVGNALKGSLVGLGTMLVLNAIFKF